MPDIQNIALRHLTLSPLNVRKIRTKEAVAAMAASILAQGLLQNLHVHTQADGGYGVVIGGTRLAALQLLLRDKKITGDFQVACEVHVENDAKLAELSLTENVVRSRMHPADEFDAFAKLTADGEGPAEIGARFGQTARYVQQRMKLAAVSPKLLAIFRKGEMSLDQLEAFTIEPDTKRQEKVWRGLEDWQREGRQGAQAIRAALTEQQVATDSRLARFVGLDAYRQAGGAVTSDLFAKDEDAGYITDVALLQKLAAEKLEAAAAPLREEGWKFVDVWQEQPENHWDFGRLRPDYAEPTGEAAAEMKKLDAEGVKIQKEFGEEPEDEDAYNRLLEIQQRIDELSTGDEIWKPEQKQISGVTVTIDRDGELTINRGAVRPEDKRAAAKAGKGAAPAKTKDKEKPAIPAALMHELTAHKTVAAQLELSGNPPVALRAVTHALAIRLFYDGYTDEHTSLGIKANEPTFPLAIRESIEKSATGKKLAGVVKAWTKKLPKEPEQLWAWIEKQPKATVESLLAVCAAMTVDVTQVNGAEAKASSVALAAAIKLDMSEFWQATAENYFTRVPKKLLLEELGTAVSATTKRSLEGMKRDALGKTLTAELRGEKWLPPLLRAGKPGVS